MTVDTLPRGSSAAYRLRRLARLKPLVLDAYERLAGWRARRRHLAG